MRHKTRLLMTPHTPLSSVWRVVNEDGSVQWELWTHCADRNASYEKFLGTSLTLYNDGSITQAVDRGDDIVHMIDVMEAYND